MATRRPAFHLKQDHTTPLFHQNLMAQTSLDIDQLTQREYPYGFSTDLAADTVPRGLSEEVIALISAKKQEPEFLRE